MMTLTIEIPALDRLCGILEQRDRGNVLRELQDEIVALLKEAATGNPSGAARHLPLEGEARGNKEQGAQAAPPPADIAKGETAPEPRKPAQEPTSSVMAKAAPPSPEGEGLGKPVTLADVQKAAAQMRDEGKLEAVKALFPDFGIRKLSDLKGDALQGFADRLRDMGARI